MCLEVEHVSSTCLLEPPGSNNTVLSTGFSQSWPAPAHMSCLADSRAHTAGHWRDGEQRRVSHGHTQTSVNGLSDLSQYGQTSVNTVRPQSILCQTSVNTVRPTPSLRRVSSLCEVFCCMTGAVSVHHQPDSYPDCVINSFTLSPFSFLLTHFN